MDPITLALAVLLRPQPPRLGAAADSADVRLAARVAGCYALVPGRWRRDGDLGRPYPADTPSRLRLTAEPFVLAEDERGGLARPERLAFRAAAATTPGAPPGMPGVTWGEWRYWQRARPGTDSVVVTHVHAMAGVDLTLAPAGRGLAGRIERYVDRIEPGRPHRVSRPVRARRVPCGGPAPADSGAGAV